jgi:hypothetical protein
MRAISCLPVRGPGRSLRSKTSDSTHTLSSHRFLWSAQTFCVAVLFIDMLEKIFQLLRIFIPDDSNRIWLCTTIQSWVIVVWSRTKQSKRLLPVLARRELLLNNSASLDDDCSAQYRHRESKLAWLEPSGHEDSEYNRCRVIYMACLSTKHQYKTSGDTIFCSQGPLQSWSRPWHTWPQVMEIAAFQEFYNNDRILTVPPVANIWLTFFEVFIFLT